MNLHSLARTCPASRELLVRRITDERWRVDDAARAAGVSTRTAYKWLARFRSDGIAGLRDRSSRPVRMPRLIASEWQLQVLTLRREHRMTSPTIARQLRMPRSTVCRILRRELGTTCASFFERAIAWFASLGIRIERVISDNGSGYRSFVFAQLCNLNLIRHSFTKAYRPQTNGKAERFIQTLQREWAYARPYDSSGQRREVLRPMASTLQSPTTSWQSRRRDALRQAQATRMNNVSRHHS